MSAAAREKTGKVVRPSFTEGMIRLGNRNRVTTAKSRAKAEKRAIALADPENPIHVKPEKPVEAFIQARARGLQGRTHGAVGAEFQSCRVSEFQSFVVPPM